MPIDSDSFVFVISLAAVVNGLGIVRWLTGFTEYLRRRPSLRLTHYWVFTLAAGFQFLLHVLFWWSLWSIRGTATINFLSYLFLLSGPVLLFIGSAMLAPDLAEDEIDLREHYSRARPIYASVLIVAWLWAILLSPVLRGSFAPTLPYFALFLVLAIGQRLSGNPTLQGVLAVGNWLLLLAFVAIHAMQLGGATG
ncbi:MAG: hypothetical protein EX272_12720 [Chromatiales bacterium]|nr:MAG: hypothetical protein EX272_12720 [Chromatiales bacterium]